MKLAVCVKHGSQRVSVDPLSAEITVDDRDMGLSPADEAALELALQLGDHVTVVSAGDVDAERSLRAALEVGADQAIRCPGGANWSSRNVSSRDVAVALADAVRGCDLVLCGDYSADRGSGSVPAFLAAELGVPQALGVVALFWDETATPRLLMAERRLDRGRRELLQVAPGAVVSVEGSTARLRRAPLSRVLTARDIEIGTGQSVVGDAASPSFRVHRPRVQLRPAPEPSASPLERIEQVTETSINREPPRVVRAEPADAAREIFMQLQAWGYLE